MPTLIKILTIFAEDTGFGWSEVHYKNVASSSPNLQTVLSAYIASVAPLRAAMLGRGTSIVGFRASYPRANAIASLSSKITLVPDTTNPSATYANSLAIQFIDSTFTRKKIVHVRGFWDTVDEDSGYTPVFAPGWEDRYFAWKDSLIAGTYGWPTASQTNSFTRTVTGYTSDTNELVTFTLADALPETIAVNQIFTARFSRLNNSKSVLNRTLLVKKLTATTVITTSPIAAGKFTGEGKLSYRATEFVAYASTGPVTPGKLAMGKPLNRLASRLKARPRL